MPPRPGSLTHAVQVSAWFDSTRRPVLGLRFFPPRHPRRNAKSRRRRDRDRCGACRRRLDRSLRDRHSLCAGKSAVAHQPIDRCGLRTPEGKGAHRCSASLLAAGWTWPERARCVRRQEPRGTLAAGFMVELQRRGRSGGDRAARLHRARRTAGNYSSCGAAGSSRHRGGGYRQHHRARESGSEGESDQGPGGIPSRPARKT